jgi:hypothetical protein
VNYELERMGKEGILAGKLEVKRELEWRNSKEEDIKIDLKQTVWVGGDWINIAQDRDRLRALVTSVIKLRVP